MGTPEQYRAFQPHHVRGINLYLNLISHQFPNVDASDDYTRLTPNIPLRGSPRIAGMEIAQMTAEHTQARFQKPGSCMQLSLTYKTPEKTPEGTDLPVYIRCADGSVKIARHMDYNFFADGTVTVGLIAQDVASLRSTDLATMDPDLLDIAAFKQRLLSEADALDHHGRLPVYTGAVETINGSAEVTLDYTGNIQGYSLLTDTLAFFSQEYGTQGVTNFGLFMTRYLEEHKQR